MAVMQEQIARRGYQMFTQVLNTATHGYLPQNRKRWFAVLTLSPLLQFDFPAPVPRLFTVADITQYPAPDNYIYREGAFYDRLLKMNLLPDKVYKFHRKSETREHDISPALLASMGTGGNRVPVIKTAQGIRKFTPKECFFLQGVWYPKFPAGMADTHLYKQAGNGVTATVVTRIMQSIINSGALA